MILVTGAAGYIGSMLIQKLQQKYPAEKIRAIDNFKVSNIRSIGDVEIKNVDITDKNSLQKHIKGIDTIIHLAGITGIQNCEENPLDSAKVNVIGTKNIADLANAENVNHIMYSSTSAVYGLRPKVVDESTPTTPINFYGVLRKSCEDILLGSYKKKHLGITIFRQSNIYGKSYIPKNTVVNIFANKVLKNESITIFGDGTQVKNFLHVEDTADAYINSLIYKPMGIFNLGGNENFSVNKLAEIANETSENLLGYKVPVIVKPKVDNMDNEIYEPSLDYKIDKLKKAINFQPAKTISYAFEEFLINQNRRGSDNNEYSRITN